ncbi:hypothetical protein ATANTOWER_013049 [Ataeniobius toweri]|uniref:Uncharacterized protein n=1 Tax=Ataeniobius toweri TaxID=208326 RepID=A0ABU7BPD2_9TELE|nr:hypothetical protein [Ataeniobius toweri]
MQKQHQKQCKTLHILILLKNTQYCSVLKELKAAHSTNIIRRHDATAVNAMDRTSYQHNKFMSKIKFAVISALSAAECFAVSVVSSDRRYQPLNQRKSFSKSFLIMAEVAEGTRPSDVETFP